MRRILVTPVSSVERVMPLFKHVEAQREAFEAWHWWVATQEPAALAELKALADRTPWIVWVQPEGLFPTPETCALFYELREYHDPQCVYVRLNQDVSWMTPTFLDDMFAYRERAPRTVFLVHANAVGNRALACVHDRLGCASSPIGVPLTMSDWDQVARNPQYMQDVYDALARSIAAGTVRDDWTFPFWKLDAHALVPLHAFAWLGDEFQQFDGRVPMDEEMFLNRDRPFRVGRSTLVYGRAVCAVGGVFPGPVVPPAETAPEDPPSPPHHAFPPPMLVEAPPAPRKPRRSTRRTSVVNVA